MKPRYMHLHTNRTMYEQFVKLFSQYKNKAIFLEYSELFFRHLFHVTFV